jgi:uncharacterized membrane protein YjjP (DUF1212 family)
MSRALSSSALDELGEAGALLRELGQALHEVQAPADAIEEQLTAVARGLDISVDLMLFQSYLAAEIRDGPLRRVRIRRVPFDAHWRLARLQALLALAGEVADGSCGAGEARARLAAVLGQPNPYRQALVVPAYGVYSAAVAARVGGAWLETAVAGLLGLVAGLIHVGTITHRRIDLQKSFLAGAAGTLGGLLATLVLPAFDVGRAVFGAMTLLVPAMVITIAIHELANDALESGTVRLAYGLLRFTMLALGIAVALGAWTLVLPAPPIVTVTPLPLPLVLALLAIGGLALVVCLQARARDAPWIVAAVLLAYGAQQIGRHLLGEQSAPLLAALLLGLAAELFARQPGRLAVTVVAPGLLQLAPGFLGTQAMFHLLGGHPGGEQSLFRVVLVALQLVIGLLLAHVLLRRLPQATPRP